MKKVILKSIAYTLIWSIIWLVVPHTQAAALTGLSDTMSRLKASTLSDHDFRFRFTTGMSSGTIQIDFPADFVASDTDYTDVDLRYGSDQAQVNGSCASNCTKATLAASAGADAWGAVFDNPGAFYSLTFSYPTSGGTAITANDYVRIAVGTIAEDGATGDNQVQSSASTGSKTITITAGADTGKIGVVIVTEDQIGVSATVDPTLTFTLADLTLNFGSFVGTDVRYADNTASGSATEPATGSTTKFSASTNGINGWSITIRDEGNATNPGLYSATLTELIPTDTSRNIIVTGNKKKFGAYGKGAEAGVTIHENFDNDETDSALSRTAQVFATTSEPTAELDVDMVLVAAVDATTKAGAYSDTITVICTGHY